MKLPGMLICGWIACFTLSTRASGEDIPPTWFPLGAPFRVANSGTIVNGDKEKKLPLYDQAIPEVYQFAERDKVQKGLLAVVPNPRWYTGVGKARPAADIPSTAQGTSLSFGIVPLPEGRLRFDLAIEAEDRDVSCQIEHRRNDITPFLFQFAADGVPLTAEDRGGATFGGVKSIFVLVKKGERGSWSFTVDPRNLLALAAGKKFTGLSVVAAFSELRQENGFGPSVGERQTGTEFIEDIGEVPVIEAVDENFEPKLILIRSKPVILRHDAGKWSVQAEAAK
ncbi:hypothetical protein [Luteolibacter sp. Populi]|uniref:hypothetical protein n=1 Tax=Luteolibacter sp. Populi TaxID=3230487 RepID=UPI0034655634